MKSNIFYKLFAAALGFLFAQYSYSEVELPQFQRLSVPLVQSNGEWVAPVDLPKGATRFSIVFSSKQEEGESEFTIGLVDSAGAALVSGAPSVNFGEEQVTLKAGEVYSTPRFNAPSKSSKITIKIIGNEGLNNSVQILGVEFDMGGATSIPQSFVDDGSTEVCKENQQKIKDLARSVARLRIPVSDGLSGYCTGFAIGPKHLLTNNHCVKHLLTRSDCKNIGIEFNYSCSTNSVGVIQAECVRIIPRKSKDLDYAVLEFKLREHVTVSPLEPISATKAKKNEYPFMLHHSAGVAMRYGKSKMLIGNIADSEEVKSKILDARKTCMFNDGGNGLKIYEPNDVQMKTVLTHGVSTVGGASGSPVFVGDKVVGLHFDQDPRYDPPSGCYEAKVKDCMVYRLQLPNWAVQVCDVLNDIPETEGIKKCAP